MKKVAKVLIMLTLVSVVAFYTDFTPALAASYDDLGDKYDGLEFLEDVGREAELYNPLEEDTLHRRAVNEEGINVIQTVILQVIDVAKYILGTLAVIFLTILGIKLTVASAEDMLSEAKRHFTYVLTGFVIVMVADYAVANVFFGAQGEVLATEESARFFASQGSIQLQGIYSVVEVFVGAIAVLVIIINGFRMVTSAGEEIDAQRKGIIWAVVGLVMIALSELVVKNILFENQGSGISISGAIELLAQVTNFISAFVAFISVALVIYAGVQYLISFVSEGSNEKGKKALIAAIIGILIVAGSYALTNTMIMFQG